MRLVAKHAEVGYQTPGERPGCRNCAHFDVVRHDSPIIAPRTACTRHGLEVTSGGICPSHKLQRKPGEAQLVFLRRQGDLLASQAAELSGDTYGPELGRLQEMQAQERKSSQVKHKPLPHVGEMHEGKVMTVARHRRLMAEQIIAGEEASGDPELIRIAAQRRRWIGMPPQAGEERA